MYDEEKVRLTDAELHAFFDRLFPHGFAGADVLSEIAPEELGTVAAAGVLSSVRGAAV